MNFARPEYLWALLAVPLTGGALLLEARRRARLATGYPIARLRHRLHAACLLAGVGLLSLAAAGPKFGHQPAAARSGPGRLVVALDCSKSMLARDLVPNRLAAAKGLIADVLARLPGLPVGLVIFGGRARLACPITPDRPALAAFLRAATPAEAPLGGTNLTTALEASRLALLGGEPGAVLLVSDGENTLDTPDTRRGHGPPIVTVAVGGTLPAPLPGSTATPPVTVGVDVTALTAIATASGGRAFRLSPEHSAPGPAVAAALAGLVPTGQRRPGPDTADRTRLCLFSGLVFLAADLVILPLAWPSLGLGLLLAGLFAQPTPALAGSSAAAAVTRGLTAWRQGHFETARDAFLDARARDPDEPRILFDLGAAFYRLGRYDLAQNAFARAARTGSGSLKAHALYNAGNTAFRRGDSTTAVACYQAALALNPSDAQARANLAFVLTHPTVPPPQTSPKLQQPPGVAPGKKASTSAATPNNDGHAPPPQGRDHGQGPSANPASEVSFGSTQPSGPHAGTVPLAGRTGEAGGVVRARPGQVSPPSLLDTVPDLPGLPPLDRPDHPRAPVEKDW